MQPFKTWIAANLTPRTEIWLGVLIVILAVWTWMIASEAVDELQQELTAATAAAVPVPAQIWQPRLEAAQARLVAAEAGFWAGATTGEVNARILTTLQQAASSVGFSEARITIANESVDMGGLAVVNIVVEGQLGTSQLLSFLNMLRTAEGRLVVKNLLVQTMSNGRIRIEMLAPLAGAAAARPLEPN